ncbi:hypothetical protein ABZ642_44680 [Streptomyces sp. NPDC007157]|uniref:alpha/beta fold hydrolase n=1 Tax=Streptomyces sp. NPDC007157 TaxID=3154681 RepID=UPI0033D4BA61
MAGDIRALLHHLGVQKPITIVSHDLGMLVGYAYASLWPDVVARLMVSEALDSGNRRLRKRSRDDQVQREQDLVL